MALFHRLTQLITADLHSLLDRLEEPEVLLRQSIREMEEVVAQERQQLQNLQWKLQQLEQRRPLYLEQGAPVEAQMALCFENGRQDLARKFVIKKLETERALIQLDQSIRQGRLQQESLRQRLEDHQQKLQTILAKAPRFSEDQAGTESSGDGIGARTPFQEVPEEEIELAFIQEKKKHTPSREEI